MKDDLHPQLRRPIGAAIVSSLLAELKNTGAINAGGYDHNISALPVLASAEAAQPFTSRYTDEYVVITPTSPSDPYAQKDAEVTALRKWIGQFSEKNGEDFKVFFAPAKLLLKQLRDLIEGRGTSAAGACNRRISGAIPSGLGTPATSRPGDRRAISGEGRANRRGPARVSGTEARPFAGRPGLAIRRETW